MRALLLDDGQAIAATRAVTVPDIDFGVVDWDFPTSRQAPLHGLHPYPAKFIPEIPAALISLMPPPKGTVVLDPFCGSGTTLVEAQRAGLPSVGIDLNPVAILLSRVKTGALPKGIGQALSEATETALLDRSSDVPEIPRLDHWFKPPVQVALARLGRAIASSDPACRDLLRLAMSSIVVRVSNQDSDTRYAAVPKQVDADDVFRLFVRSARGIVAALEAKPESHRPSPAVNLIETDILQVSPQHIGRKVGLVITSPPYPNAYEYWLYHKYRMWWLGFDPIAVKDAEIGARAHFFGGKKHTALDFTNQMGRLAGLLGQVVVPGGHACFVVGRSRIHGVDIDNASVIGSALEGAGFECIHVGQRTLRSNRKSFNLSHANIKTETVLIARRSA